MVVVISFDRDTVPVVSVLPQRDLSKLRHIGLVFTQVTIQKRFDRKNNACEC